MCGDRGASRLVDGDSKTYLYLHGKPLFIHALEALGQISRVKRVFIIGDKKRLDYLLEKHASSLSSSKLVTTLDQWDSLLSNAWNGFLATIDNYEPGDEDAGEKKVEIQNKAVFLLPGDSPIVSADEINDFFDKVDLTKYDHVTGLTSKDVMKRYYPTKTKPGIKMAYLHFREGDYRINNLHVARPCAYQNSQAIQQAYNSRYQKDIKSIINLTRDMWVHHVKLESLVIYFLMQVSMFLRFIKLEKLNVITRRFTPLDAVAAAGSRMLGTRFGFAFTNRGGAALDIDNESDYEAMKLRYFEWKQMQTID
jgi:hypothetical protein